MNRIVLIHVMVSVALIPARLGLASNDVDAKRPVLPNTSAASVGRSSAHELPAHSLTVIRIKGSGGT